eukprot:7477306-Pyramimonas_sp.AAC.1
MKWQHHPSVAMKYSTTVVRDHDGITLELQCFSGSDVGRVVQQCGNVFYCRSGTAAKLFQYWMRSIRTLRMPAASALQY